VAEVKKKVPPEQWCDGKHSPSEIEAASPQGFFSRLFD
jgi:hypothetical protein